jgi:hypothetical protein
MLSSGGVGYFEYEATVDGNATLSLDVPLDQVDDILKSLVVYDDSGTAGEITARQSSGRYDRSPRIPAPRVRSWSAS